MEHWFVFDMRKQFQDYEASFAVRADAVEWAASRLGEHAFITNDYRATLVRPKSLNAR